MHLEPGDTKSIFGMFVRDFLSIYSIPVFVSKEQISGMPKKQKVDMLML